MERRPHGAADVRSWQRKPDTFRVDVGEISKCRVENDGDCLACFDVNPFKPKQGLERHAVFTSAWWRDEPKHNIISIHGPCVGHVDYKLCRWAFLILNATNKTINIEFANTSVQKRR